MCASLGTTGLCAFDELSALGPICKKIYLFGLFVCLVISSVVSKKTSSYCGHQDVAYVVVVVVVVVSQNNLKIGHYLSFIYEHSVTWDRDV